MTFHYTGHKKSEGNYSDGKKDGYFKYYNRKGFLQKVEQYRNGEVAENNGEQIVLDIRKTFYDNAKVKTEGTYRLNIKEGAHHTFSKEGDIIETNIYKDGVLVGKGLLDEEGKKEGKWEEYYESGKLRATGLYKEGNRFKKWKFYYESGQLEQEGSYNKNGKFSGKWNWFYEDGSALRKEYFSKGKEDGFLVEYDNDGIEITKGEYKNGLKQGLWDYHVGDHTEKGSFLDGEKDGVWYYYFENGKKFFVG